MLEAVKNNVDYVKCTILPKATPLLMFGTTMAVALSQDMYLMAGDQDAVGTMKTIVKIVAKLVLVLGLMLGVMGVIAYATAHSEGDGPAQNKATMKIVAGIMLIALSVTFGSDTVLDKLFGNIDFSNIE